MKHFRIFLLVVHLTFFHVTVPALSCGAITTAASTPDTAEQLILYSLEAYEEAIDLRDYRLLPSDVVHLYQKLLEQEPQLFYVSRSLSYTYDQEGAVLFLYPQYTLDQAAVASGREALVQAFERVKNLAHPHFSDADKALLIHDHLALTYTYSPDGEENYDAYALLREGHGVCQAFSLMFIALGRCLGLEVDMVTSLSMDHAWNHVRIGCEYYHIDVTRDLPSEGESVSHDRFLICDRALRDLGYHDYACPSDHLCQSHSYEYTDTDGNDHGLLCDISGGALYLSPRWLVMNENGVLLTLSLDPNDKNERLSDQIDPNEDGILSISDVLHPGIQGAPPEAKDLAHAVRQRLLELAIQDESGG